VTGSRAKAQTDSPSLASGPCLLFAPILKRGARIGLLNQGVSDRTIVVDFLAIAPTGCAPRAARANIVGAMQEVARPAVAGSCRAAQLFSPGDERRKRRDDEKRAQSDLDPHTHF
jgi:hypothetical protein